MAPVIQIESPRLPIVTESSRPDTSQSNLPPTCSDTQRDIAVTLTQAKLAGVAGF